MPDGGPGDRRRSRAGDLARCEAADVLETPPRGLPSLRLQVDQGGTPLTIFSTHPATPIGPDGTETRLDGAAWGQVMSAMESQGYS